MTRKNLIALAAAGSAALLLGALAFQYIGGLAPCKMCIWQRWPHAVATALAVLAWRLPATAWLGAAVMLVGSGVGLYHAGVEQGWWEGPNTCTSGPITGQSAEALLDQIMNAPLVRCDEIAWSMAGISMAGWNAIFSLILAFVWIKVARHPVL